MIQALFREINLQALCHSLFAAFTFSLYLLQILTVHLSDIEEPFLQTFFMLIAMVTLAFSVRKYSLNFQVRTVFAAEYNCCFAVEGQLC